LAFGAPSHHSQGINLGVTMTKSIANEPTSGSATGTVERVLKLLAILADAAGSVSIKEVAEQLALPPSTVHRLLQLLKAGGFAQGAPESRQYAIGPQFYRVAARVTSVVTPAEIAQPFLEQLARMFDEAVVFGLHLPEQGKMSFVGRADGAQRLKYQIDMFTPVSLVWGASGKAILAYLPTDRIKAAWTAEAASPGNGETRPSLRALNADLGAVRERGFATSNGEKLPDARGIAAPVRNARGVIGSICLTAPVSRTLAIDVEEIGRQVADTAEVLSIALGAPPPP
jgi:DNA-binding IclR family transcriptional regulator